MSTETKAELDGRSLLATLADLIAADDPAAAIASIARQAALLTHSSLAVATYQAHEEAAPEVAVFAAPGVDDVPARLLGPALHAALRDAGRSVRWPSPSGSPLDAILDAANVGDSVLAAPLGGSTAGAGSVAVVRHATSSFAEADESLLLAFAATASAALERTQLVADLEAARAQREAFFGVLSHELRTPMTTIYGGTRVLRQSGTRLSHDARQQLLDDVGEEAERLYRLVEDLLVLSRTERNALPVVAEPMLVQHVLARVVASEQQRWPRARFRLVPDVGLPPVMGDSTLV